MASSIEKLIIRKQSLMDRLHKATLREHQVLSNRGWGYAMRNVKIGFSTRVTDNIKQQLKIVESKILNFKQ